jgi:four helix bundle protein
MLRIYVTVLEVVRLVAPLLDLIEKHDRDLARQGRRSLASVPLNVCEGSYMSGGNRVQRYRSAMGSMKETNGCVDTAEAFGYIPKVDPHTRDRIDFVIATLYRTVH